MAAAAILAMVFVPAIAQDRAYHNFADGRTLAGVPNFWNVLSNAGFMAVGILGLARPNVSAGLRSLYTAFCLAIIGVGFGSSWYHLTPSVASLVWDRLPMSVAFMALFSAVLGERISWQLARTLRVPLMLLGAASVLYWYWTETRGAGDLRAYGIVQFLPVVLMPLMLLTCPGSRASAHWLWLTLAGYALAKLAEHFDGPVYQALGLSGHSIKHMLSALAVWFAVLALQRMEVPADGMVVGRAGAQ